MHFVEWMMQVLPFLATMSVCFLFFFAVPFVTCTFKSACTRSDFFFLHFEPQSGIKVKLN